VKDPHEISGDASIRLPHHVFSLQFAVDLDKQHWISLNLNLSHFTEAREAMTLIDDAVRQIRAIAEREIRDSYARALRSSIIWDGVEDGRKPTSAEAVVATSGLGPAVLENNLVLLTKRNVALYATEQGSTKSLLAIRKSLTGSTYMNYFNDGRVDIRNGKRLLITYAEARSLLGIETKGTIPPI
jgi:hypothetical protein